MSCIMVVLYMELVGALSMAKMSRYRFTGGVLMQRARGQGSEDSALSRQKCFERMLGVKDMRRVQCVLLWLCCPPSCPLRFIVH